MNDIQLMTTAIARIEDPATPIDEIAETINQIDFAVECAVDLKKRCEAALTSRIKATGKSIQIGQWLWALKTPKTTKCVSNRIAAEACFTAVSGDFDQFCQLLSSDAFKHGACSKVLPPEVYEGVFQTTYPDKLEKKLVKLDTNFLPKKGEPGTTTPELAQVT